MPAERAPAKVNLSLHVLARRPDGWHALESLVAFADVADELTLEPDAPLGLSVEGASAALAADDDNLVMRAARGYLAAFPAGRAGRFHLVKQLPVAAGLGGGSSDAAAALRLLARANGLGPDDARLESIAAGLGADVPVCLDPRPAMMQGAGEAVTRLDLPELSAVLVNPGVPLATPAVFARLGLAQGETHRPEPHPPVRASTAAELAEALRLLRNDLEPAALELAPEIGEALGALRAAGATLARMSGSGATVWGLGEDRTHAKRVAALVSAERPDWWVRAVRLGSG
jgi:4-diphosphocytidyl-2-C-methyl-D-erythritol kinase